VQPLRASIEEIAASAAQPPVPPVRDWPTSPQVVGVLSGLAVAICALALACGISIGRRCRPDSNRAIQLDRSRAIAPPAAPSAAPEIFSTTSSSKPGASDVSL
tara:strand:- start:435 stop:743 length:309 start_codon:yes stop_codon:yes gene_type:complete